MFSMVYMWFGLWLELLLIQSCVAWSLVYFLPGILLLVIRSHVSHVHWLIVGLEFCDWLSDPRCHMFIGWFLVWNSVIGYQKPCVRRSLVNFSPGVLRLVIRCCRCFLFADWLIILIYRFVQRQLLTLHIFVQFLSYRAHQYSLRHQCWLLPL